VSEVVKSAGLQTALASQKGPAPASPRRASIQLIRQTLRKHDSTDEEVDEALEALVELSKD
jgi:hypothetical protein